MTTPIIFNEQLDIPPKETKYISSKLKKYKYFNLNPAPTPVRMQIYVNMTSRTLPTSDIDLDLTTLPAPEAGDFVELLLLCLLKRLKALFCEAEIAIMITAGLFDVTVSVDVGEIILTYTQNFRSKKYQLGFHFCRNCLFGISSNIFTIQKFT
jgi:hypothetical protein